jgi:hypothetical protein
MNKKVVGRVLAVMAVTTVALSAWANDQYHVYKVSNGDCEIDTRTHQQMKDQRDGTCLGHADNRTDAEKMRVGLVKSGACKCPSGQNCT